MTSGLMPLSIFALPKICGTSVVEFIRFAQGRDPAQVASGDTCFYTTSSAVGDKVTACFPLVEPWLLRMDSDVVLQGLAPSERCSP